MIYCSKADDKSTGEPSRYIRQIEFETGFTPERVNFGFTVNFQGDEQLVVEKSGEVLRQLQSIEALYPTAICQYVICPMKFYLSRLARVRTEDELTEDVDARSFGNVVHDVMYALYAPLQRQSCTLMG